MKHNKVKKFLCIKCKEKWFKQFTIKFSNLTHCLFCELKFAKHIENKNMIFKIKNLIREEALKMIK